MKDFLREMLIEPFEDGEFLMGLIAWIVFTLLVGILSIVLFWLVDSSFMPIQKADGVIVEKTIVPAHYETIYNQVGDVMIPTTIHHDEEFYVTVEIDNCRDDVSVYETYYHYAKVGDVLHCTYTNGRLSSNSLYIKKIE